MALLLVFVGCVLSEDPEWLNSWNLYEDAAQVVQKDLDREPRDRIQKRVYQFVKKAWLQMSPKGNKYYIPNRLSRALSVVLKSCKDGSVSTMGDAMLSGYAWAAVKYYNQCQEEDDIEREYNVAQSLYEVLVTDGLHEQLKRCAEGQCNERTFQKINSLGLIPDEGKWRKGHQKQNHEARFSSLWSEDNGMFMQFIASLGGANTDTVFFSQIPKGIDAFDFLLKSVARTFSERWNKFWTKRFCGRFCNRVRYVNKQGYVTVKELANIKQGLNLRTSILGGQPVKEAVRGFDCPSKTTSSFQGIFLGSAAVGKTSIIKRFLNGEFRTNHIATIGVDFARIPLDAYNFNILIYDPAGSEVYAKVVKSVCAGKHIAFLVYDISERQSFEYLDHLVQDIRERSGNIPIIVVGNKVDLAGQRQVTTEEGEAFTKNNGAQAFVETSAKENIGIGKLFDKAGEILNQCK